MVAIIYTVDVKLIKVAAVNHSAKYLQVAHVVPKDVHPLLVPSQMVQQKTTVEHLAINNMMVAMI